MGGEMLGEAVSQFQAVGVHTRILAEVCPPFEDVVVEDDQRDEVGDKR